MAGAVVAVLAATTLTVLATAPARAASFLPAGFADRVVLDGLSYPSAVEFAPDGRVFVAERSGVVKVYDGLADRTPTVVADLTTKVYNAYDRGLLGLTVDPGFPTRPYVYVAYTHDAAVGGTAPRWGTPGDPWDECPNPPGANTEGCVVSGRVSRLTLAGDRSVAEQVLVEDWCQQFSSHSMGDLTFGPDGYLYASAGEGASFGFADYGQVGNPCADPPGAAGTDLVPATAEGGSLRAQSVRRPDGEPAALGGSVIRVDPDTGAGAPDNPLASSSDPNRRRVVAYGLRNPLRVTFRPGTHEMYVANVGAATWEEVERVLDVRTSLPNFGWPCYEGPAEYTLFQAARTGSCDRLYRERTAVPPLLAYRHSAEVVPGDGCAPGSSSITGAAFQANPTWPETMRGALFLTDFSRGCIWYAPPRADGVPDPARTTLFQRGTANAVDLEVGPDGDLFYVDVLGGALHRISYTPGNTPPTAVVRATPAYGPVPLAVTLTAAASSDPDGDALSYSWDLDGDGVFGDARGVRASRTYTSAGTVTAAVRVSDARGARDVARVVVAAGNTPPVPQILAPTTALRWVVGQPVAFSGNAVDAEDGALPTAALVWRLAIKHCPSNCHQHPTAEFTGVGGGSFDAPDHEYPARLLLTLEATDSRGLTGSTTVELDPAVAQVLLQSRPTGLQVQLGEESRATPWTADVISGSRFQVTTRSPQASGGRQWLFSAWSDGGRQTHTVAAPVSGDTTLTATFADFGCPPNRWRGEYFANATLSGRPALTRCDDAVAFDWGSGAPPGVPVPADGFSVRWTRAFGQPLAGPRTVWVAASDGVRVLVDGVAAVQAWGPFEPSASRVAQVPLANGGHVVTVEYRDVAGGAVVKELDAANLPACPGWTALHWTDPRMLGEPAAAQCGATAVGFTADWGSGAPPGTSLPVDGVATAHVRRVTVPVAARKTFSLEAADGGRLWVDGRLVVDAWAAGTGSGPVTASRQLTAGTHVVVVESYDRTGPASVTFSMR